MKMMRGGVLSLGLGVVCDKVHFGVVHKLHTVLSAALVVDGRHHRYDPTVTFHSSLKSLKICTFFLT